MKKQVPPSDAGSSSHSSDNLEETLTRLSLAVQGAELGTWDWDIQNGHVRFNDRWAEMLGYGKDELEPSVQTWEKLLHTDDKKAVSDSLQEHLDGHTTQYSTEHRLQHKHGHYIWVFDSGQVYERTEGGTPLHAAGIHLDITDRKRHEMQEADQKRFIHLSSELIQSLVHIDDIDSVIQNLLEQTGRYMDVSRAYLFRFDSQNGFYSNTHEWCSEGVEPQIDYLQGLPAESIAWWDTSMRAGEIVSIDDIENSDIPDEFKVFLIPQGISAVLSIPLYVDGTLHGFIGFDETRGPRIWHTNEVAILKSLVDSVAYAFERDEREQVKDELEKMKAVNKMGVTISHEFNNALAVISGSIELLQLRLTDTSAENKEFFAKAMEHVDRMRDLVMKMTKLHSLEEMDYALGLKMYNLHKSADPETSPGTGRKVS
ncbi:PAS domain-containing protein [bacterium]|nr:PAS domain-containing protein [bacterium]